LKDDDDALKSSHNIVGGKASKRSLSPSNLSSSPPRKQSKSKSTPKKSKKHVKTILYTTPKKSEIEELAKSPMKTQNIFDRLTASSEQMKKYPKIPCPVCSVGVTEKFLNIHLDKCLKVGEDSSPVIKRTKCKDKKVSKPSVKDHLMESQDSEEPFDMNLSDSEDEMFSCQAPPRVKRPRSVVKPSIVETSDDHETLADNQNDPLDDEGKSIKTEDGNEECDLNDTTLPPSPLFGQYTETMTQGTYSQSQRSEQDMFASGSEAENHGKTDLDSSRNLLDLDDDIECMMEAALSEHEESAKDIEETQPTREGSSVSDEKERCRLDDELSTKSDNKGRTPPEDKNKLKMEKSQPKKSKKRAVVKIYPKNREENVISEESDPYAPPTSESLPCRPTRRTTRLGSKARLN